MKRIASIVGLAVLLAGARPALAPAAEPLGSYAATLRVPGRAAADAAGRLYVADAEDGAITTFDAFGRVSEVRPGPGGPRALAVDAAGRLLVGDSASGSVGVYDADWNLLYPLGAGAGEFQSPTFVATDPSPGGGAVYVSDGPANRVSVYTNGALAFRFGTAGAGPGQFDFPAGLCVTTNEIFVVDQNNDRVEVFDRSGAYLREFSLVIRVAPGLFGLAGGRAHSILADGQDRLYVADAYQGLVKVFNATGGLVGTLGSLGDQPGQLRTPSDLALDPCHRLFVASPNNGRVEVFGLDSFIHLAAVPSDATLAVGTNLALVAYAAGGGPFIFQWRRGTNDLVDGGGVSGATNATLQLSALATNDVGDYSVVITGPTGAWTSGAASVAVQVPPSLLAHPVGATVAQGSNVLLHVAAGGDSLAYQWFKDDAPVPGATGSSLAIPSAQPGDAGAYAVAVSNAVGRVTSDTAVLLVLAPPQIVLPPADEKTVRGDTAFFDVLAHGDQLAYRWLFNGSPAAAPDSAAIALPNVQPPSAGAYAVVVTNPVGAVTSATASLSVFVPPATQELQAVEVDADQRVRVQLAGDAGFTFALDASTNLQEWLHVTNIVSATGAFEFIDMDAGPDTQRFYRLRWRP